MTTDMFLCCHHNPVLSSFMTYHRVCNTTGVEQELLCTRVHPRFLVGSVFVLFFWTSFCLSFLWLRILITPLASLILLFGWSFVQLFSIILEFCLDGMHGLTIKTIERWTKSETIFIIMIDDLFKCRPSYIHVNYCFNLSLKWHKTFHNVRTVFKSNLKIIERDANSIPLTHRYLIAHTPDLTQELDNKMWHD